MQLVAGGDDDDDDHRGGEDDDDHDDHRAGGDDDDDEALLDAFPLSLEELHRLQQGALFDHDDWSSSAMMIMIIPDERLLTKMLQQSAPTVFCCFRNNNDPKSRWWETIVSVCGRRGDRFLFDMLSRFLFEPTADDDADIESFVSLLLQECCYPHPADHADSDGDGALLLARWMPLFRSNMNMKNQKNKNDDDDGMSTTTTTTTCTKNWKDWLTRYLPGCSRVIAAAYSRHFGLAVTSPLVWPMTTTTSSSVDDDDIQQPKKKKFGNNKDNDDDHHDDTTSTSSTTTTRFLWQDDDNNDNNKNRRVVVATTNMIDYQVALMGLGGRWYSLYDSTVHGLSFLALQQHLLSFAGPTLLLIQTTNTNDDEILGVYTERAWQEPSLSSSCQDNDDNDAAVSSFLFRLSPQWGVYRQKQQQQQPPTTTTTNNNNDAKNVASSSSQPQPQQHRKWQQSANHGRGHHHHYQYLNHHRHRRNGGHLAGLAFGGMTVDTPRIHLTLDLDEHCIARCYDGVFDDGNLLSSSSSSNDDDDDFAKNYYYFTPARIQVWVRADETLHAHLRTSQEWSDRRESTRQRAATVVDKRPFLQDLLTDNAKVFAHRNHQMFQDEEGGGGGRRSGVGGG